MSNKSKAITLRLAPDHNRIHCIRLVRLIGSLLLWDAKTFVDDLEDGKEKDLVVSKARLTLAVEAEMSRYGLHWKDTDK